MTAPGARSGREGEDVRPASRGDAVRRSGNPAERKSAARAFMASAVLSGFPWTVSKSLFGTPELWDRPAGSVLMVAGVAAGGLAAGWLAPGRTGMAVLGAWLGPVAAILGVIMGSRGGLGLFVPLGMSFLAVLSILALPAAKLGAWLRSHRDERPS